MRYITAILVSILAVSAAYADEIVLEPKTFDAVQPVHVVPPLVLDKVRIVKISTPGNAVTPEGNLEWGRLVLGEHKYLFCMEKDGKEYKNLYLDSDGDANLKEEKQIAAEKLDYRDPVYYFVIENVAGEFKLGNGSLSMAMKLWLFPWDQKGHNFLSGAVGLFSGFYGEIEQGNIKIPVAWFPGKFKQLVYKPGFAGWVLENVYFRGKRLSLLEYELAVKENKLRLTYNISEDKNLVRVKVPDGITEVVTHSQQQGQIPSWEVCIASDHKVYMPPRKYRFVQTRIIKESAGCKYELSSTTPNFLASNGSDLGKIFPLKLDFSCSQNLDNIIFKTTLTGASKSHIRISKDGEFLSSLKLLIKDSDGREVLNKEFGKI